MASRSTIKSWVARDYRDLMNPAFKPIAEQRRSEARAVMGIYRPSREARPTGIVKQPMRFS
jgi:hypothetical protein